MIKGSGLTRRSFLYGTGAAAVGLSLSHLSCEPATTPGGTAAGPPTSAPVYESWQDIYRTQWTWDSVSFEVHVKLSYSLRPGQVVAYHGWEPYQFKEGRSHQSIFPSPINPIQLAGGYFHLQPFMITGEPGHNDRGTRLEVEPLAAF